MTETLLMIVTISVLVFAAIQLCTTTVNDLISNEASFAILRCAVVSGNNDNAQPSNKTPLSMNYVLAAHYSPHNFIPLKSSILSTENENGGNRWCEYEARIDYLSKIFFGSIIKSCAGRTGLGDNNMLKNTARARMVRSPDQEYYVRAYKNARSF